MDKKSMIVVALSFVVMLFILLSMAGERDMTEVGTVQDVPVSEMEQEQTSEPATAPTQQMKIDVRVACESALMYTTFPDGASADAYVAECIEGKHPEVIERYINDMGVDGAMI